MIATTLKKIQENGHSQELYEKLRSRLGEDFPKDEPLPFAWILGVLGLEDTLWLCHLEPQHDRVWRTFAIWAAKQEQPVMRDRKSEQVIQTAEQYLLGQIDEEALYRFRTKAESWPVSEALRCLLYPDALVAHEVVVRLLRRKEYDEYGQKTWIRFFFERTFLRLLSKEDHRDPSGTSTHAKVCGIPS